MSLKTTSETALILSFVFVVGTLGMLAGCDSNQASAEPGHQYEMTVYDPSGATEIAQLHAERVSALEGQTICLLSDFMWEAERTMERIESNIVQSHPQAAVVPPSELPDVYRVDLDDLETAVNEKGCQAAIVGNAG